MPAELSSRRAPVQRIRVALSAPTELSLASCIFTRWDDDPREPTPEWAQEAQAADPELRGRIERITPGSHTEWGELILLADRMGVLFDSDMTRFFNGIEAALAADVPAPPMPSETTEEMVLIEQRLKLLREDPELRARYIQLLRDVWAVMEEPWRGEARAEAETRAEAYRKQLESARDIREVLPRGHLYTRERYGTLLNDAMERGEVTIVPLALAGRGGAFFALPGAVLIAPGANFGERWENRRIRAEAAAGRLKALSDPTRLAILDVLAHSPRTMTELANDFQLAQPTISIHLKLLREVGLVTGERDGKTTVYRAEKEGIRRFALAAVDEVIGPGK